MIALRPGREADPAKLFLWWMSLPTFVLFGAVTFKSAGQINWPIAGYISGMVISIGWLQKQWGNADFRFARISRVGSGLAACVGLLATLTILDTRPYRSVITATVAKAPTDEKPFPLRQFDPTCRLRGWRYLGGEVDKLRNMVKVTEGEDPTIAGFSWMTPGQLGFFCADHPPVYTIGTAIGDRRSQYDLWHPNPVADAQVFRGRTFLVVGTGSPDLTKAFDEVAPARQVIYREAGQPLGGWSIWVCRGYRGFDPKEATAAAEKY